MLCGSIKHIAQPTCELKNAERHTPDETADAFCMSGLPSRTTKPDTSKMPNMSLLVHTIVFCIAMSVYKGRSTSWYRNELMPFSIIVTLAVYA